MSFINFLRCIVLLITVFVFPVSSIAESSWSWQHPYPTGSNIHGIQFIDNNNGWITTTLFTQYFWAGELFRTEDGGINWIRQYVCTVPLSSVFFLNSSDGWACGGDGTVLRTTNGGDVWSSSNPTSDNLLSIEFVDENYGTIVGTPGTIMRTMNGGEYWQAQGSGITFPICDVSFVNSTTGWTTGTIGSVLYTETAGAFWQQQNTGILAEYSGIHFFNESYGFAAGDEYITFTDNGGESWSTAHFEAGASFSALDFSENLGAASCREGFAVAVSENEGLEWMYESLGSYPPLKSVPSLHSVSVTFDSYVYTGGDLGLMYSRDSEGNWSQLSSHETLTDLKGITHFDENHVWACGYGSIIMRSSNGGENWESQIINNNYSLYDICFPTVLTGYCVGTSSDGGVILKTVNSGSNWTEITPTVPDVGGLYSVDFFDENCGVAVGLSGEIIYTTDGGATWTEKIGFGSTNLTRVRFGNTDRGWIVGNSGKIICFDFSSDSWSEQTSAMANTFYGLFALDADTAWAVGWNGTIVRTLNAGKLWETMAITGNDYNDVWFAENGLDGYFTAYDGYRRFGITSNGGYTVSHSSNEFYANMLKRISFIDVNNGWGCCESGRILRYGEETTGIEDFNNSVSSTHRTNISSSPNPFKTSSTVSFDLPDECHTTLHLYDITGRMVQSLHEGNLQGGEHSFMVDGANLAPGMYFLRLTAGGAAETRSVVRIP